MQNLRTRVMAERAEHCVTNCGMFRAEARRAANKIFGLSTLRG